MLVAGALSIILIAALVFLRASDEPLALRVAEKVTDWESLEEFASWSPDRSQIAFSQMPEGNHDIYTMPSGTSGEVKRWTDSPADEVSPRWSPDGRYLAFASGRRMQGSVHRLDLKTGVDEELVVTGVHGLERIDLLIQSLGMRPWSPDGKTLLYSCAVGSESIALFEIDLEARESTRLTEPDASVQDLSASFMPQADWILFTRTRNGVRDI